MRLLQQQSFRQFLLRLSTKRSLFFRQFEDLRSLFRNVSVRNEQKQYKGENSLKSLILPFGKSLYFRYKRRCFEENVWEFSGKHGQMVKNISFGNGKSNTSMCYVSILRCKLRQLFHNWQGERCISITIPYMVRDYFISFREFLTCQFTNLQLVCAFLKATLQLEESAML